MMCFLQNNRKKYCFVSLFDVLLRLVGEMSQKTH